MQTRIKSTTSSKKYHSKQVFYDLRKRVILDSKYLQHYKVNRRYVLPDHIYRFDSTLEFKTWLELVRIFGLERVERQYPLQVIPSGYCYPYGKKWHVDFAIRADRIHPGYIHYVESKGVFLPEFGWTLAALEQNNHEAFNKLRIVFSAKVPHKIFAVKALLKTEYAKNILTLGELKQLNYLP